MNEGEQLAQYLSEFSDSKLEDLSVYGDNEPIASLKENLPEIRVMSIDTMKSCLLPYLSSGLDRVCSISLRKHAIAYSRKICSLSMGIPKQIY